MAFSFVSGPTSHSCRVHWSLHQLHLLSTIIPNNSSHSCRCNLISSLQFVTIIFPLLALLSQQPEKNRPLICSLSRGHAAPTWSLQWSQTSMHRHWELAALKTSHLTLHGWYILMSHFVAGVAMTMLYPALFTLVCAQSPQNMKGFMMGVLAVQYIGLVHLHRFSLNDNCGICYQLRWWVDRIPDFFDFFLQCWGSVCIYKGHSIVHVESCVTIMNIVLLNVMKLGQDRVVYKLHDVIKAKSHGTVTRRFNLTVFIKCVHRSAIIKHRYSPLKAQPKVNYAQIGCTDTDRHRGQQWICCLDYVYVTSAVHASGPGGCHIQADTCLAVQVRSPLPGPYCSLFERLWPSCSSDLVLR